ncbi:MAG: oxidoreductase, partial [Mycobacterium sp.]|nr:oxidoreductase [Mycobacterium sp.]
LVDNGLAGSIISVTSIEGVRAAPGYVTYAAAKAGVINYTKTAALELAPHNIRVNALAPDLTVTERPVLQRGPHDPNGSTGPRRRDGRRRSVSGVRHVELHHRADDSRRRRNAGRQRLVPQPAERRLPTRAQLVSVPSRRRLGRRRCDRFARTVAGSNRAPRGAVARRGGWPGSRLPLGVLRPRR